ncbi:class I SAM-dependent methyltransferase [Candidatus Parcubacteria bacterium]|nr:class I SAM-dependent methyltransferase [Candidatus Parcubacteria bacterium]
MNDKLLTKKFNKKCIEIEDKTAIEFLNNLDKNKKYNYLEVGAGLGRFPLFLKNNNFDNLKITCLEINEKLNNLLKKNQLNSITGSIKKAPFKNETFDIIHCSHVIEHFSYPDITKVLNEMFRIVKTNGYVIIRSPLMHLGFYNDIDHVRPYPPKCILQYFNHDQQQKKGNNTIKLIKNQNRRHSYEINLKGMWRVNQLLKLMWINYEWPRGKTNGYTAIFQKVA